MIDLRKAVLPSSVMVEGKAYKIHTEHCFWINFSHMLAEKDQHFLIEFDFLYDGEKPQDRQKGLDELFKFYSPERVLPRALDTSAPDNPVVDYIIDGDLIYSAFMEQYHIDLIDTPLHWHKFLALFSGLHQTKLNDVMGYRLFNENDKTDYKHSMMHLREAWKIDQQFTEEEQAAIDKFDKLLKGSKAPSDKA